MQYRCVASSPEGLVQQVAVSYLRHGYWFYVTGRIKSGKDPAVLDQKWFIRLKRILFDGCRGF